MSLEKLPSSLSNNSNNQEVSKHNQLELIVRSIPNSIETPDQQDYSVLINKFSENNIQRENLELKKKTEAEQMNNIRQQLGLSPLEDLTTAQTEVNKKLEDLENQQNEVLQQLGVTELEYKELIKEIEQKIKKERVQKIVTFFKELSVQEQTYITYYGTMLNGSPVRISGISIPSHELIKKIFSVFHEHQIETAGSVENITLEDFPELHNEIEETVSQNLTEEVSHQIEEKLIKLSEGKDSLQPDVYSPEVVPDDSLLKKTLPEHKSNRFANAETISFEDI